MKTRDEVTQMLTDIGTIEDPVERRAMLTQLTDEVNSIYDSNETLSTANQKFEADNKKLQEYNMQLFLRVGQPKPKEEPQPQNKELKYENLFNEQGELK